jgi:hypothetical protein
MENKVNEKKEIGKKLPVSSFLLLDEIGIQMCFRECEAYSDCLSINFNRKKLMCELNNQKANESLRLVDDEDFIYLDIPGVVSMTYLQYFLDFNHLLHSDSKQK